MCVVVALTLAAAVVSQANQCSSGSECPSDIKPSNVASLLETKVQMGVLKDGGEDNHCSSASECPSDDKPQSVLSLLQTNLRMNVPTTEAWKKLLKTSCRDGHGQRYESLSAAQDSCVKDFQCNGVYDDKCDGSYYPCTSDWSTSSSSCVYERPKDAPTTKAATMEAPTTEAPTTVAPTTEAPTTEAPTTEVTSTTEASSGTWLLGDSGASYTSTCSTSGKSCITFPQLSGSDIVTIASRFNISCAASAASGAWDPALWDAKLGGDGKCHYNNAGTSTCAGRCGASSRRFCYCEEAPTTEAPATEARTTEAPTTEAPTTPTTEAPTTEAPTTEMPPTDAWKKLLKSSCRDGHGQRYDSLSAAQDACVQDFQCNGVYDVKCDGSYYPCTSDWSTSSSSCVYERPKATTTDAPATEAGTTEAGTTGAIHFGIDGSDYNM